MNVKCNAIIFSTDNEERKDVRRLKEKKLQVLLDDDNNLPLFDIKNDEYIKVTISKEIENLFGTSKFYIEQLYTWGDPKHYEKNAEMIVTYLIIINKNNIRKMPENMYFYDISIEDIENEKTKKQEIILASEKKKIKYKIETIKKKVGDSIEYTNRLIGKTDISELTTIIIHTGIKRLRNRIENTNIAFSFLEKEFTLSELQQVYEIILDKKLVAANFRKKIEPMVKKTEKIVKESAYRPSARYVFNEDYLEYWV